MDQQAKVNICAGLLAHVDAGRCVPRRSIPICLSHKNDKELL